METSTLSWKVSGATSVTVDPEIRNVAVVTSSKVVAPTATTAYTLTASNAAGSTTSTPRVLVSKTLPSLPGGLSVIKYFVASPSCISPVGSTALSWSVSSATLVTVAPGVESVGP